MEPTIEAGVESLAFLTDSVLVGEFRCRPDHPNFRSAGRIRNFSVAFPRTAVWIHREHHRPFVADPGVATIYSPGEPYERRALAPDGDRCDWFAVSEPIARDIVADHGCADAPAARLFSHATAPVSNRLYVAQRRVLARIRRGRYEPLEIEERVIRIVHAVMRAAHRAHSGRVTTGRATGRVARDVAEEAKALMSRHLRHNLTLSAIATHLAVSPYYLCRAFRAKTGTTLYDYRRSVRLRTSLELTDSYRGNLSALAVDLGFYSHSHFSAAFRETFGAAPSSACLR